MEDNNHGSGDTPTSRFVSVSKDIGASPQRVFELVSDLPRMGEWSPEATGGHWKGSDAGPAVGAKFVGRNRNGWRRWSTLVTVVEHIPPSTFAFDVTSGPIRVSRWRYDIEPTDSGCRVTESWEDHRSAVFAGATGLLTGIRDRRNVNAKNMAATLDVLAESAEAEV